MEQDKMGMAKTKGGRNMKEDGLCMLWIRVSNKEFLKKVRDKYKLAGYSQAIDKLEEIYEKG
jgi:hypothetical protein